MAGEADFDLHGLARVRVTGSPDDVAVVARQLGPLGAPVHGRADVVVEFLDRVPAGPLQLLGRDEFGYDGDSFYVLRGKHKSRVLVRLPFDQVGGEAVVLQCERGLTAVPLLIPIVNLAVLANGGVALHAGAFEIDGRGVVVTGWSKGGKTETLLAMLGAGARYVGDEWVYIDGDGRRACGVPEPIRIWDWYLGQLDGLPVTLRRGDRARLAVLASASRACDSAGARLPGSMSRRLARLRHLLDGQRHVDLPPAAVLGGEPSHTCTSFDLLLHAHSTAAPTTRLCPADPLDVAARMAASLEYERLPLLAAYDAFRYAFPDRRSELVDSAASLERERLAKVFAGKEALDLSHPYPPTLAELRGALLAHLRGGAT